MDRSYGDLMSEMELEAAGVVIDHPTYRRVYADTLEAMRAEQGEKAGV